MEKPREAQQLQESRRRRRSPSPQRVRQPQSPLPGRRRPHSPNMRRGTADRRHHSPDTRRPTSGSHGIRRSPSSDRHRDSPAQRQQRRADYHRAQRLPLTARRVDVSPPRPPRGYRRSPPRQYNRSRSPLRSRNDRRQAYSAGRYEFQGLINAAEQQRRVERESAPERSPPPDRDSSLSHMQDRSNGRRSRRNDLQGSARTISSSRNFDRAVHRRAPMQREAGTDTNRLVSRHGPSPNASQRAPVPRDPEQPRPKNRPSARKRRALKRRARLDSYRPRDSDDRDRYQDSDSDASDESRDRDQDSPAPLPSAIKRESPDSGDNTLIKREGS